MCLGCYKEYGSPVVVTTDTQEVVRLISDVYRDSITGGGCHVVLDDWNIEDDTINYVLTQDDIPLTDTERICMTYFLRLSEDERATALAIHDGFIDPSTASPPNAPYRGDTVNGDDSSVIEVSPTHDPHRGGDPIPPR